MYQVGMLLLLDYLTDGFLGDDVIIATCFAHFQNAGEER